MGLKLFKTFLQAGLPAPQLRRDLPVGGGPGWLGFAYCDPAASRDLDCRAWS
jgi:hypothetical protein